MSRFTFSLVMAGALALPAAELSAQSPVGEWESTQEGRGGTVTLTFSFMMDGDVLKGTMSTTQQTEPVEMSDVSFEDGTLKFSVTRTRGDNSFVLTYTATIEGDNMTGTRSFGQRGGGGARAERAGGGGGGGRAGGGGGGAGRGGRGGRGGSPDFTATRVSG